MNQNIYEALAEHQVTNDWEYRGLVEELHRWARIFDFEFNLKIPQIAVTIDALRRSRLGHFRRGHNGFGLKSEIALNRRTLSERQGWQILGTLLHELLHAWQESHGSPGKSNYHNKEFREKALQYGLVVDHWGHTQYAPDSPSLTCCGGKEFTSRKSRRLC